MSFIRNGDIIPANVELANGEVINKPKDGEEIVKKTGEI